MLGTTVDIAARVMALADGDQILCTRSVFDNARQFLPGERIKGVGPLSWLIHGQYKLKGIPVPTEICEVGEKGRAVLTSPPGSVADDKVVVGEWRPQAHHSLPDTDWVLTKQLGEGGFGETWKAEHRNTRDVRAFKFSFRPERVRNLKQEKLFFDLIRKELGESESFVRIYKVNTDHPPYYLEMEYVEALDLRQWLNMTKQAGHMPSPQIQAGIVAQVAEALARAHAAGVVHNDVAPGNILIRSHSAGEGISPSVVLSDFGIGRLVAKEKVDEYYISALTTPTVAQTKPMYLAPELLQRQQATPQSDIYSLGVILYQLYKGDMETPVPLGNLKKYVRDPIILADVCWLLAADPGQRPGDGKDVARRLGDYSKRKRTRNLIRGTLAGVFGAMCLALALVVYWLVGEPKWDDYVSQLSEVRKNIHRCDFASAKDQLNARSFYEGLFGSKHRDWEWGRLRLLSDPDSYPDSQVTLKGGSGAPVNFVGFTPDSDHIFSCGEDNIVRVWNLKDGKAEVFPDRAKCVACDPDGIRIACCGQDNAIRIWNVQTHEELGGLRPEALMIVHAIAFSPDGRRIAAAGAGTEGKDSTKQVGRIELWNTNSLMQGGEPYTITEPSVDAVTRIAFSPDGRRIAGTGLIAEPLQTVVKIWDSAKVAKVVSFGTEKRDVNALVFSPDKTRKWLVTGGGTTGEPGAELKIWNCAEDRANVAREFKFTDGAGDGISALAFNRRGGRLAFGAEDGTVRVWAPEKNADLISERAPAPVRTVAFSRDGLQIAAGCSDGTIVIWPARPWK